MPSPTPVETTPSSPQVIGLYIGGPMPATESLSFLVSGPVPATGSLGLHTSGPVPNTGSVPVFLQPPVSLVSTLTTFMSAPTASDNNISVYAAGPVPTTGNAPLYIRSGDPIEYSSNVRLFIYGSLTTVYPYLDEASVYVAGGLFKEYNNDMPLYITAPGTGTSSGSMPLYINNFRDSGTSNQNLGIYLYNDQTTEQSWIRNKFSTSVYLNATYGQENNMSVYVCRKGFNDSQELTGDLGIHLENKQATSNLDVFVNSVFGHSGSVELIIPSGIGSVNTYTTSFIRGYEE